KVWLEQPLQPQIDALIPRLKDLQVEDLKQTLRYLPLFLHVLPAYCQNLLLSYWPKAHHEGRARVLRAVQVFGTLFRDGRATFDPQQLCNDADRLRVPFITPNPSWLSFFGSQTLD